MTRLGTRVRDLSLCHFRRLPPTRQSPARFALVSNAGPIVAPSRSLVADSSLSSRLELDVLLTLKQLYLVPNGEHGCRCFIFFRVVSFRLYIR